MLLLASLVLFTTTTGLTAAYFVPISTEFMGNKAHVVKYQLENVTTEEPQVQKVCNYISFMS
jgi:hypothetical protein